MSSCIDPMLDTGVQRVRIVTRPAKGGTVRVRIEDEAGINCICSFDDQGFKTEAQARKKAEELLGFYEDVYGEQYEIIR